MNNEIHPNRSPTTPAPVVVPPAINHEVPGLAPALHKAANTDDFEVLSNASSKGSKAPSRSTSPAPKAPASRSTSPAPKASTSRSTSPTGKATTAGTEKAAQTEKPVPPTTQPVTDLQPPATRSTLESLLDACKDTFMALINLAVQVFVLVNGMANNSALQAYGKVTKVVDKVVKVTRSGVDSLRSGAKVSIDKVRGYTSPSLKPAEGRYEQSKFWVKAKINNSCNWMLHKIG